MFCKCSNDTIFSIASTYIYRMSVMTCFAHDLTDRILKKAELPINIQVLTTKFKSISTSRRFPISNTRLWFVDRFKMFWLHMRVITRNISCVRESTACEYRYMIAIKSVATKNIVSSLMYTLSREYRNLMRVNVMTLYRRISTL